MIAPPDFFVGGREYPGGEPVLADAGTIFDVGYAAGVGRAAVVVVEVFVVDVGLLVEAAERGFAVLTVLLLPVVLGEPGLFCQRLLTRRQFNAAGWVRGKSAARSIAQNFFRKKV